VSYLVEVAVVTSGAFGEDDAVSFVNERLAESRPGRAGHQLRKTSLDGAGAGGTKVSSLVVYAACFNYLDLRSFEEAVTAAPWRLPACVAVYVDDEAGPVFVFSPARQGRWLLNPL
jgi:hypothetical protein